MQLILKIHLFYRSIFHLSLLVLFRHVKMEEPVSRVSNTILATVSVNKVSQENIARKVIHMSESFLYIQGKSTGNVV